MGVGVSAKFTISLPEEMLARVEQTRRETGQSRSEFILQAITRLLAEQRAQAEATAYADEYARRPETLEEIAAADRLGAAVLALEPWD